MVGARIHKLPVPHDLAPGQRRDREGYEGQGAAEEDPGVPRRQPTRGPGGGGGVPGNPRGVRLNGPPSPLDPADLLYRTYHTDLIIRISVLLL